MLKNKKTMWIGLAALLIGVVVASSAGAGQNRDKTTSLTFMRPVEVPGHILPAGTYTFRMADATSDRHIVQVLNTDGDVLATFMTIPDYRLVRTDHTVVNFSEMPAGSPDAIRGWFYPGDTVGEEFVYPKARAAELARASNAVVPAVNAEVADVDTMKTATIIAVTPDQKEAPVAAVIQTTPPTATVETPAVTRPTTPVNPPASTAGVQADQPARTLPKTASTLPIIVLFGFASLALAVSLMASGKAARTTARR